MDPLLAFPPEINSLIFTMLPLSDIGSACQVNTRWATFLQESDHLWIAMCRIYNCNVKFVEETKLTSSWEETFKQCYLAEKTKQRWVSGEYRDGKSASTIQFCRMSADMWGEILDAELSR